MRTPWLTPCGSHPRIALRTRRRENGSGRLILVWLWKTAFPCAQAVLGPWSVAGGRLLEWVGGGRPARAGLGVEGWGFGEGQAQGPGLWAGGFISGQ